MNKGFMRADQTFSFSTLLDSNKFILTYSFYLIIIEMPRNTRVKRGTEETKYDKKYEMFFYSGNAKQEMRFMIKCNFNCINKTDIYIILQKPVNHRK